MTTDFVAPVCPQLVDPRLDCHAFALLTRLRRGVDMLPGIEAARSLVTGARPLQSSPVFIVVATDVCDVNMARVVDDLRRTALQHGVPVVHSMTPRWLGSACKSRTPQFVVTVVGLPNPESRRLASAVLSYAARACGEFVRAVDRAVQFADVTLRGGGHDDLAACLGHGHDDLAACLGRLTLGAGGLPAV